MSPTPAVFNETKNILIYGLLLNEFIIFALYFCGVDPYIRTNFKLFFLKSCSSKSNIPRNCEKTTALSYGFIFFKCYINAIILVLLWNYSLYKFTLNLFYLGRCIKSYFLIDLRHDAQLPNYYIWRIIQVLQNICKHDVITGSWTLSKQIRQLSSYYWRTIF